MGARVSDLGLAYFSRGSARDPGRWVGRKWDVEVKCHVVNRA